MKLKTPTIRFDLIQNQHERAMEAAQAAVESKTQGKLTKRVQHLIQIVEGEPGFCDPGVFICTGMGISRVTMKNYRVVEEWKGAHEYTRQPESDCGLGSELGEGYYVGDAKSAWQVDAPHRVKAALMELCQVAEFAGYRSLLPFKVFSNKTEN